MTRLAGRRALVTGAAGDFGRAIGEALVAAGATVMLTDLDASRMVAVADALGGAGCGRVATCQLDVRDEVAWQTAIAATIDGLGGLDIVVNNAGIELAGFVTDVTSQAIDSMLSINLKGAMLGTKHALRAMRPGGEGGQGGAIVNIASAAGAMTAFGMSIYGASKAGLMAFSRTAAVEAARMGTGVRINCVLPGMMDSAMARSLAGELMTMGLGETTDAIDRLYRERIPAGRYGSLSECAGAVVYLCSDEARYVTGVDLRVDGGVAIG